MCIHHCEQNYKLLIFFISFFKFMYICIWKHMKILNDDLIVRIVNGLAIFISIWASITGFATRDEYFLFKCSHQVLTNKALRPQKLSSVFKAAKQSYRPSNLSIASKFEINQLLAFFSLIG